jgi:hypothetical protein
MTNRVSNTISDQTLNRGIQIESAGKPNAKASTSSATGLFQFLNQSWLEILYLHGPLKIAKRIKKTGNPKKPYSVPDGGERAICDMRKAGSDPALLKLNIDMGARLWEDNAKALGKGWTDGDLYLSHFLGIGGARKVFRADPNASAVAVCGQKVADANHSIFYRNGQAITCSQLRAWATNSMKQRWAKAGEPDWIGRFYPKEAHPEAEPANHETSHEDRPPIKLDVHERDEEDVEDAPKAGPDNAAPVVEPDVDESADPSARAPQEDVAPVTLPAGVTIKGDPETWMVQFRLQRMHYGPSMLDGRYGGKTSAAIAAFLNDYPPAQSSHLTPPKTAEEFLAMRDALKDEIGLAENEGWVRPVTVARQEASPEVMNEVAPEAAPIQRNKTVGIWGMIVTAVTGFFNWAGDSLSSAWDFFTGHQDDIPDVAKDPSTLSWLWSKVTSLPGYVWLGLVFAAFMFFVFNSASGLKTITDKVKTGER